jgi:hypothetical protein
MSRLTITLSDNRYRALKEASVARRKSIGQLIDESLDFYGVKTRESALEIFRRAGQGSDLNEEEAMELALREVRAHRDEKTRHR